MAIECQEQVYSEEYEDFIVEYTGQRESIEEFYGVSCYQLVDSQFGVVYQRPDKVEESQRNTLFIMPRCFGLLSSNQTMEEADIFRVQRQPNLALYGQGVLLGIIDTGAGVRDGNRSRAYIILYGGKVEKLRFCNLQVLCCAKT